MITMLHQWLLVVGWEMEGDCHREGSKSNTEVTLTKPTLDRTKDLHYRVWQASCRFGVGLALVNEVQHSIDCLFVWLQCLNPPFSKRDCTHWIYYSNGELGGIYRCEKKRLLTGRKIVVAMVARRYPLLVEEWESPFDDEFQQVLWWFHELNITDWLDLFVSYQF